MLIISLMASAYHFWHTAQISTYGRCVYGNPHGCPRIHFVGGKGGALTVEIYDAFLENYPGIKLYMSGLDNIAGISRKCSLRSHFLSLQESIYFPIRSKTRLFR